MPTETTTAGRRDPVIQFSVFTPNRLGRLHVLIGLLGTHDVHVLALMVLDTTDSSIIRIVVDDPDRARDLLVREGFPFTESRLVVVEVNPTELNRLMAALLEAELNINYLYSFIPHPQGKSMLALSMEDNDLAEQALRRHQFRTLKQTGRFAARFAGYSCPGAAASGFPVPAQPMNRNLLCSLLSSGLVLGPLRCAGPCRRPAAMGPGLVPQHGLGRAGAARVLRPPERPEHPVVRRTRHGNPFHARRRRRARLYRHQQRPPARPRAARRPRRADVLRRADRPLPLATRSSPNATRTSTSTGPTAASPRPSPSRATAPISSTTAARCSASSRPPLGKAEGRTPEGRIEPPPASGHASSGSSTSPPARASGRTTPRTAPSSFTAITSTSTPAPAWTTPTAASARPTRRAWSCSTSAPAASSRATTSTSPRTSFTAPGRRPRWRPSMAARWSSSPRATASCMRSRRSRTE